MSVRMEPAVGVVVQEAVDELAIDVDWQAVCDQVRAALHRTWLPVYGGSVRAALAGGAGGSSRWAGHRLWVWMRRPG